MVCTTCWNLARFLMWEDAGRDGHPVGTPNDHVYVGWKIASNLISTLDFPLSPSRCLSAPLPSMQHAIIAFAPLQSVLVSLDTPFSFLLFSSRSSLPTLCASEVSSFCDLPHFLKAPGLQNAVSPASSPCTPFLTAFTSTCFTPSLSTTLQEMNRHLGKSVITVLLLHPLTLFPSAGNHRGRKAQEDGANSGPRS